MSELSEEDERILGHLRERAHGGDRYFRAKHIADAIGLTAKQVGSRLPRLAEHSEDVDIEKWSRARSTTWRVTPE
jgi:DNA-binding Lrp family transcriptional regulator